MTNWILHLVRAADLTEFAAMVAQREADRGDGDPPPVVAEEADDLAAILASYPSWPEDALRRLAAGTALTAQRWTRALDVVAVSDDQTWFTTSEIAESRA